GPVRHPAAVAPLTQDQLRPILDEAVARWTAAGADPTALRSVGVQVVDLAGGYLGWTSGSTIKLDRDAAGYGWFIDPTRRDDREFDRKGDQGEQGRMDLLTVLMHEMGHALGLKHDDHGVMRETLAPGTRRLPDLKHDDHGVMRETLAPGTRRLPD